MMRVSKTIEFDAAHRVPLHESKCKHLHGHRYKVVAICEGQVIPDEADRPDAGMVIDFGVIKDALVKFVHDQYDHRTIVWEGDDALRRALVHDFASSVVLVPFIPTAERLAEHIMATLRDVIDCESLRVVKVDVWETPTSVASID